VITVFTAGVQSIAMWWAEPETDPMKLFLMKLACVLAAIMLALSAVIVVATLASIRAALKTARQEEPPLADVPVGELSQSR